MAGKQAYTTDEIIDALKATDGLVSLAAKKLQCSPQTIYNRAKNTQSVQQAIDDARDSLVDYAVLALRSAVLEKQPWAVQFTLKTLGRDRGYVERTQTELSGPGGGAVVLRVVYEDKNA